MPALWIAALCRKSQSRSSGGKRESVIQNAIPAARQVNEKIEIQHGKDRGITSDCYNIVLQRAYPPRLSRQLSGEFRCHFA